MYEVSVSSISLTFFSVSPKINYKLPTTIKIACFSRLILYLIVRKQSIGCSHSHILFCWKLFFVENQLPLDKIRITSSLKKFTFIASLSKLRRKKFHIKQIQRDNKNLKLFIKLNLLKRIFNMKDEKLTNNS